MAQNDGAGLYLFVPPKPFQIKIRVRHHELDTLGHVNNAVYLNYLEQAAIEHSDSFGFTLAKYQELHGAFVLRKMEIEYLLPAFSGNELIISTWAHEMQAVRATRRYEIHRANNTAIPELLVRAEGLWVWVDTKNGKLSRIPEELQKIFTGQNQSEAD